MSRLRYLHLNMLDSAVAGKDHSVHRCHDAPSSIGERMQLAVSAS
jgi:hypothetical protein